MESGLLLDVVVRECSAIFQLLTGEDESLLVGRDALLVLDLGLDVLDGVRGLDVQSDGLASQGLDEDLHATAQAEHEVESALLLDVVVGKRAAILQLLPREDQALLIGWNAFFILQCTVNYLSSTHVGTVLLPCVHLN